MPTTPTLSLTIPIASGLACGAFAVSILVGVSVEQPGSAILARSVTVLLLVWPIGLILGAILNRIFREHVEKDDLGLSEGADTAEENNAFDFVDETRLESDGSEVGAESVGAGT